MWLRHQTRTIWARGEFKANGYKLKQVFADAALYCTTGAGVAP